MPATETTMKEWLLGAVKPEEFSEKNPKNTGIHFEALVGQDRMREVVREELKALGRKAREVQPFVAQARQEGRDKLAAQRDKTEEARRDASAQRVQAIRGAADVRAKFSALGRSKISQGLAMARN